MTNYAPDCGCGQSHCNNGWLSYNGSEYPCGGPSIAQAPETLRGAVSEIQSRIKTLEGQLTFGRVAGRVAAEAREEVYELRRRITAMIAKD